LVFQLSDQHAQSRHGNEERLRGASETVVLGDKLKSP
jgi:hypothetical protein